MKYLLDTANVEDIKKAMEYYPVDGVTTNPTIISKEKRDFFDLVSDLKNTVGDKMLHVQVTSGSYDDIIKEAKVLREIVGNNLYVKIPITPDGLKATMELKKLRFNVTETAIFNQQQALIAAKAGADYVAPYVNRLDNSLSDGTNVVKEIVDLFKLHGVDTQVLAASFKNCEQIHKVAMAGGHAVTITPDLLESLIRNDSTNNAISKFNNDWENIYGDDTILSLSKKLK